MDVKFIDETFDDIRVAAGDQEDEIVIWQVGDAIVIPRAELAAFADALKAWAAENL